MAMSWIRLKTKHGVIKIKPRSQLRHAERVHAVKVYDFGLFIVSWWPDEMPGAFPDPKPVHHGTGMR